MLHTIPRPKFSLVSLYDKRFLSYGPIFGRVHRMTPNDLDMYMVKSSNTHVTYTPKAQIFVPFSLPCLWWAVFELRPNFFKSTLNDPKWSWHVQGQIYQHACYIHPRPKFSFVSLYDEPFLSYHGYGPIFGKVHQMTPNDLDMFKVKYTNMDVTYHPEAQIFVRFALQWAVFELWPNFRKSAPNDPKWPWLQTYQTQIYIMKI